jgi:hypothetical protein
MPVIFDRYGLFNSPVFASCSRDAEHTYFRLLHVVDDRGFVSTNAREILALVYANHSGIHENDVHQWLDELERAGAIRLAKVDGHSYFQLTTGVIVAD